MSNANFAMVGLGVMGRNLALNVADHGFKVAVWNLEQDVTKAFIAANPNCVGTATLEELVASLERPRRIMMMVTAGKAVDEVLKKLKPLLQPGDIVIDGGNTYFEETQRREAEMAAAGLNFVGMGVSGGEEGARRGPSLMPGGSTDAWKALQPILEAISAKTDSGPCVAHNGPDGAGHFVKMVHNGIEYGDMQLIAEVYDLLSRGLGLGAAELSDIFARWNEGPLSSFLIELTAGVLAKKDPESGSPLIDLVLDKAEQKGTGRWTAEVALKLGVPIPTMAAALDGRGMSSLKAERVAAQPKIRGVVSPPPPASEKASIIAAAHDALLASKICSYAQGMALIKAGSTQYKWNINLGEMARIWTGGCIIRARLLATIMTSYRSTPDLPNLLVDPAFEEMLFGLQPNWRRVGGLAQSLGIPMFAIADSLAYFDSYRMGRLPQNMTQAQRDAFGAHTYLRVDRPEAGPVHSEWLK
jgi:6-phosphogluconate dehydrogenase